MNAGSVARKVTGPTSAGAGGEIDGDHLDSRTAVVDAEIRRTAYVSAVSREAHEMRLIVVTVQGK